ncbi:MAG: glutamine synthetase type III, partial [Candidatus Methanomethylophilaceae archaeon]|nr:glutamine synthetase type III [Candidatus Methanomethylophilaceae archaeon]
AIDHNLVLMALLKTVAEKHGFKGLLHEKPFAGVNGSGKHCNWSLGTGSGIGLMSPGKTDEENLRFLTFMANVLKAVYDNNALLKSCVLTASNAHRLGANEAPPAIISSFLGTQVTAAFNELLNSKDMVKIEGKSGYSLGIPQIPQLLIDNTDRNRTSPFAFTGNRFEFRAVGSSANCSSAITVLNTITAYQLTQFKDAVDKRIAAGTPAMQAVLDETRETFRACQKVCFDGNGYSDEWKVEAAKRGLDCETSAPLMYDVITSPQTVKIYNETNVMTEVELKARSEINWEIYSKKIEIEVRVLADLTANHILPVATRYQSILLDNVAKMKEIFSEEEYEQVAAGEIQIIKDIAVHTSEARALAIEMEKICDEVIEDDCERSKAIGLHDRVIPYMDRIREHVDALEMIVDDDMWPLPKYRELLFIR